MLKTRAVMIDITIDLVIISFFIFIASFPLPYYNKLTIQKNLTSVKEIRFCISKSLGSLFSKRLPVVTVFIVALTCMFRGIPPHAIK